MNRILAACLASSKLVRQLGHLRSILPPAVPTAVMGGNLISRHNHNEPPPGSSCSEQLLSKSRETPERLSETEWREVVSSVQYQVTRRHATEPAWTGKYNDNKEKGGPSVSLTLYYFTSLCQGCTTVSAATPPSSPANTSSTLAPVGPPSSRLTGRRRGSRTTSGGRLTGR